MMPFGRGYFDELGFEGLCDFVVPLFGEFAGLAVDLARRPDG